MSSNKSEKLINKNQKTLPKQKQKNIRNASTQCRPKQQTAVQTNNTIEKQMTKKNLTLSNSISSPTQSQPSTTEAIDAFEQPKKMERSNSFFLTRKLSKIIHSITGSKENLSKKSVDEACDKNSPDIPYKFTRSRSMILLRRPNRRSVVEPKLERLSEEMEKGDKSPPVLQSPNLKKSPDIIKDLDAAALKNTNDTTKNNFKAQDPLPVRKTSKSTLISTLKRTFSTSVDKRKSVNPRWSASLVSLQEIDNMVSYEDLSFIDYDKFNCYEKILDQHLSQQDLATYPCSAEIPSVPKLATLAKCGVVRRRKRSRTQDSIDDAGKSRNSIFDSNYENNFDKRKNLYRQSLDSHKLQHINYVQRDSFQWSGNSEPFLTDVKKLKYGDSLALSKSCETYLCVGGDNSGETGSLEVSADVVDGPALMVTNNMNRKKLKTTNCPDNH